MRDSRFKDLVKIDVYTRNHLHSIYCHQKNINIVDIIKGTKNIYYGQQRTNKTF